MKEKNGLEDMHPCFLKEAISTYLGSTGEEEQGRRITS